MKTIKNKSGGWFKTDNILIDEYSQCLGSLPTLVYVALRRYKNNDSNTAWPTEEHLAKILDVSRRSIIRAIKKLVDHRLITKNKFRGKGQQWLNNQYYFVGVDKWSKFPVGNLGKKFSIRNSVGDKNDTNQVTHGYINNTNKKEITSGNGTILKISDYKPNCLK